MRSVVALLEQIATEMVPTTSCTGFVYRWGDSGRVKWTAPPFRGPDDSELKRQGTITALTTAIYDVYFQGGGRLHPWLGPDMWTPDIRLAWAADVKFLEALDTANQGTGYFEPGWRVTEVCSDAMLRVERGGIVLLVNRGNHLREDDRASDKDDVVSIKFPKGWKHFGPGQYCAFSNITWEYVPGDCLRFYFRLDPDAAPALVRRLTSDLNERHLPFRLKVVSNPALYEWCRDGAVLYVRPNDYEEVSKIVRSAYRSLERSFRPEVPAFCKFLEPGLALAEDPYRTRQGRVESFGQNRSRLVAEGLVWGCHQGRKSMGGRFRGIVERFEEEGIDLQQPWLNHGSREEYAWEGRLPA